MGIFQLFVRLFFLRIKLNNFNRYRVLQGFILKKNNFLEKYQKICTKKNPLCRDFLIFF